MCHFKTSFKFCGAEELRMAISTELTKFEISRALSSARMAWGTDYGHPMKPFFIEIPKLLGLRRQFGQTNFGAFGVFGVFLDDLSTPILVQ